MFIDPLLSNKLYKKMNIQYMNFTDFFHIGDHDTLS